MLFQKTKSAKKIEVAPGVLGWLYLLFQFDEKKYRIHHFLVFKFDAKLMKPQSNDLKIKNAVTCCIH